MSRERMDGLDLARALAFLGMVIVNFAIVLTAPGEGISTVSRLLEGKAAASFVVLAGVGLGLAHRPGSTAVVLRRALFLFVAGLLNCLVFPADILHFYAVYFVIGAWLVAGSRRRLIGVIVGANLLFFLMLGLLDYSREWDWTTLEYEGLWTPVGFLKNLFFNGFHPVIPWVSFLAVGIALARLPLHGQATQRGLVLGGASLLGIAELMEMGAAQIVEPSAAWIFSTSPMPPLALYFQAGTGAAFLLLGLCLSGARLARRVGLLQALTPLGRQTLTWYLAHILIGMGIAEELDLLGAMTATEALEAALSFTALAAVAAWLWSRRFSRGPLELLMRRLAG